MSTLEKAKTMFREAGLPFPAIPRIFAEQLKERGRWLFSTREIAVSPYNLDHYVREVEGTQIDDYAMLAHSGHGANSWAIQYYLVYGSLRLFLHLGWGGVYMDAVADTAKIRKCFAFTDEIVTAAQNKADLEASGRLTIVASDFYGSYWSAPDMNKRVHKLKSQKPLKVLQDAMNWLVDSTHSFKV